ncbi:hypothetical protein D3C81_912780 [compost metagenome]
MFQNTLKELFFGHPVLDLTGMSMEPIKLKYVGVQGSLPVARHWYGSPTKLATMVLCLDLKQ